MTLQQHEWEAERQWDAAVSAHAPRLPGYRQKGVVGEVKPHTPGGLRAGVEQLRARAAQIRKRGEKAEDTRYHLVTYRQVDGDPSRYETYVSDPRLVDPLVLSRARPTGPITPERLGMAKMGGRPLHVPAALKQIPVHECTTTLGNLLEPLVRRRYTAWMRVAQGKRNFRLELKHPQAKGADIRHEMAAFLRELATELEAEG